MKFCNQDISKTMTALSFKIGQLIPTLEKLKGHIAFGSSVHLTKFIKTQF